MPIIRKNILINKYLRWFKLKKERMTELIARQILGHHICREMDNYYQGADKIENMGNKSEYLSEYAVDLIETDEERS